MLGWWDFIDGRKKNWLSGSSDSNSCDLRVVIVRFTHSAIIQREIKYTLINKCMCVWFFFNAEDRKKHYTETPRRCQRGMERYCKRTLTLKLGWLIFLHTIL